MEDKDLNAPSAGRSLYHGPMRRAGWGVLSTGHHCRSAANSGSSRQHRSFL